MEKAATAFAPAHITGFFEIRDSSKNPLLNGSRGAGISLSRGVFTKVRLAKGSGLEIRINGKRSKAPVSRAVLRHFQWPGRLEVDHTIQVPMGSGFGTSGAGALSLALAMNRLLNGNRLTRIGAAQIAHLAEIECKTGLGTVIGEFVGGFEVRTKAGAPGIGKVTKLPIPKNTEIVCLWLGPVSKPAALSNRAFRKAVNVAGRGRVQKLLKNPARFMELSRKFAESLPGLITPRMERVLDEADKARVRCSAMMLGRSVFGLVNRQNKGVLAGIFRKHKGRTGKLVSAGIDFRGARVL